MWGTIQSALSKLWPGARSGAAATGRGWAGEQDSAEVWHAVAGLFWRRRLIILASVAFALAVATGYVAGSPRSFEAASLITTGSRPSDARRSGPGIEDRLPLLKSTAMAERLVDRLDLQLAAEFNPMLPPDGPNLSYDFGSGSLVPAGLRAQLPPAWAAVLGGAPAGAGLTDEQQAARLHAHVVDAVKARIEVGPARPSVTRIAFRSADPDLSAAAANALAELYLDDQGTWEQQSQGLEQEIERLTASIDATEKAIAALQATAAARADQPGEQDLFGLTAEREFWRTGRAQIEARRRSLEALGADPSLDQAAPLLNSDRLGELQAGAIELERQLAELSPGRDAQDQEIASLRAEMAALDEEARAEIERTAARLETEAMTIRSRETALAAEIEALDQQLAERKGVNGTEALERQAEAERELLQTYVDRLEQGQLPGRADDPDARIVAPASVPQTPQRPPPLLIYGVGLSGGLLLGILIALGVEASHGHREG
jgi:polysaccharide biosynthesis transport protein